MMLVIITGKLINTVVFCPSPLRLYGFDIRSVFITFGYT